MYAENTQSVQQPDKQHVQTFVRDNTPADLVCLMQGHVIL